MSDGALILIDLQNDYFPGGAFPLWAPEAALTAALEAIARARRRSSHYSGPACRRRRARDRAFFQ